MEQLQGITLLSIPGKLLTCILLSRALPDIHSRHWPQQASILHNHSTTTRTTIYSFAFLDLKAAFDPVDHLALWSILKNMGVPDKLVNILSRLYDGTECYVRVNGKDSPWFSVDSGGLCSGAWPFQLCFLPPNDMHLPLDHRSLTWQLLLDGFGVCWWYNHIQKHNHRPQSWT